MSERPPGPVRRGGAGTSPAGERITWTVSAGARGRRWREVAVRDGVVLRSVLLESDPAGRWDHLELATGRGLLTMHPEADTRTVHGNVVTDGGIEHLALPWSPEHALVIVGSPAALAIVLARRATGHPAGEGSTVAGLVIDDDLAVRQGTISIQPSGISAWNVAIDDGRPMAVELDADGIMVLDDPESWPLEAASSA